MLTDLQRRKLIRYFKVYDVDDDGRVAPADFERVLENVRILHGLKDGSAAYSQLRDGFMRRWDALARCADADASGGIDQGEWLGYWSALMQSQERYEEEILEVTDRLFSIFDTDEDGVIGPDEFCDFFSVYGQKTALARATFIDLDLDGDGAISRDELMEMADQFYRGDDPNAPGNKLYGPY